MKEIKIIRSFKYNSVTLPDPNPVLSADQIREFYATQYPELNNATVEGPVTKNAVATYTFARAAGAKGASPTRGKAQEIVARALKPAGMDSADALMYSAIDGRYAPEALRIGQVATTYSAAANPMTVPSAAYGMWG